MEGYIVVRFQSTPSGWRVTFMVAGTTFYALYISIHTLRVEGDLCFCGLVMQANIFQSTPSGWRVTTFCPSKWQILGNFNPHPPGGG